MNRSGSQPGFVEISRWNVSACIVSLFRPRNTIYDLSLLVYKFIFGIEYRVSQIDSSKRIFRWKKKRNTARRRYYSWTTREPVGRRETLSHRTWLSVWKYRDGSIESNRDSECLIKPWLNRPLSHSAFQTHSTRLHRRFHENLRNSNEWIFEEEIIRYRREKERKKRGGEERILFVMQRVKRPRGFPPSLPAYRSIPR